MTSLKRPSAGLLILVTLAACRPAEKPPAPPAPAVEEIPVTTSSEEALAAFHEGQQAMDVGRVQEANAHFERAAALDPGFAYAYLNVANTAASAQEFNDALERAAASLEGKSEGERLLVEINRTFFDNDAERRMELAKTLVETYPKSPRAWLTLAGMQGGLNQHQAARESLARALELAPDFIATHYAIWGSYLFNEPKDFARAEQAMLRGLEIAPDEAKVHECLGDVFRAMQELEKARQAYSRAIELDPSWSVASLKKGHVNSFLGRFEEARADYDAGVGGAREQNRITYANYRAFTHLHAGDPRGALAELAELVQAADEAGIPEDQVFGAKIFTLSNQARIALHHDLLDDAEEVLTRRAAVMRANAERVGDDDFSRQQEANILWWDAELAARRGDLETARARAEAHRALLADDRNPRRFEGYHGLLGLIALLEGDHAQAVKEYRKANLNGIGVKYHLALAEEGAGNHEQAKKLFREVAEWNFNSVDFALVRRDALSKLE